MMIFKCHNQGLSLLEAIIALAMVSIVCSVLLVSQGNALRSGGRAIDQLLLMLSLERRVGEIDEQHTISMDTPLVIDTTFPTPRGTISYASRTPTTTSSLRALPGMRIDEFVATWYERGREMRTSLVRYVFDPRLQRETKRV